METPHPLPLNTYFGTLAAGLGCFPFDCPTYLVQSDSWPYLYGIRSLMILGKLRRPLRCSVLYLHMAPARASPKAISGRTSYLRVRLEFLRYPHLMPTLFNGCGFGPPPPLTVASTWTWIGHPVSGLRMQTCAQLKLGFPSAPDLKSLTSPAAAARRTVLQKVRGHTCKVLPQLVGTAFQVLFHSPPGVLFTFPSRYFTLSVTE